jgi:alkylation response protein AidB-like acyl-CoA dehydrogenase
VNGGLEIMTAALRLEQGGAGFIGPHRHALEQAVEWAKTKSAGKAPIEDESVRRVLARVATKLVVSDIIFRRSLFVRASGGVDLAYGPMSKLFSTEAFLRDSTDLLDLTAPYSLLKRNRRIGMPRARQFMAAPARCSAARWRKNASAWPAAVKYEPLLW